MSNNYRIIKIKDKNNNFFNKKYHYNIPIYQRAYAWTDNEIYELIDDILNMTTNKYYIGVITICKNEHDNSKYDVIDGQQRLTTLYLILKCLGEKINNQLSFSYREKTKETLDNIDNIINIIKNNKKNNLKKYDKGIINGIYYILKKFSNNNIKKNFLEKIEMVYFYQIEIPSLNVDDYFETINTRGEQLEKHDILKGKMMSILNNKSDETIFSNIWQACSNMNNYVQLNFSNDVSKNIFGIDLNLAPSTTWDNYNIKGIDNHDDSKNINEIIKMKTDDINKLNIKEFNNNQSGEYKSITDFSYFLFHALVVYIRINNIKSDKLIKYYRKNNDEKKYVIDENKLVDLYDLIINNDIIKDKNNFVKDFIIFLLRLRFIFDKYIIKRMTMLDDIEDGNWSLCYIKQNNKNIKPLNTFKNYKNNILMLQSLLRVSYTSQKVMHWLTDTLEWLYSNKTIYEKDYEKELENYIIDRINATDFLNKKNVNLYDGDIDNSRIIFNYLDYLLWKKEKNKYSNFSFEFRNSIDHFYPQNPYEINKLAWKGNIDVNNFGNLSLVSRNLNSDMGNKLPNERTNINGINKSSLKLRKMVEIIKNNNINNKDNINIRWTNELCEIHAQEMMNILKESCKKENE